MDRLHSKMCLNLDQKPKIKCLAVLILRRNEKTLCFQQLLVNYLSFFIVGFYAIYIQIF